MSQRLQLVVYGDFNCPFSALASTRCGVLEAAGTADVDWRAVEHAPDIPPAGRPALGAVRESLQQELDQIRGLLVPGEADQLTLPPTVVNTRRVTAAYAAAADVDRRELRERLFAAYWSNGDDLGNPETLARLGAVGEDEATAAQWHEEWSALPRPLVPVMVMPDGYVSRGLGALARLARLATDPLQDRP